MTTVTVPVNATWRLSRAEFNTPYSAGHTIYGYGEVLLAEAPDAPEAADILRRRRMLASAADPSTYGVMQTDVITRSITTELLAETVDVNGTVLDLNTLIQAFGAFFEKWRVEDAALPPAGPPPPPTPTPTPPLTPPPMPAL